jgi:hypothetical protein
MRSNSSPWKSVIDGSEWSGYFKGVRGNLVFFNAADGTNAGIPFVVNDSRTGRRFLRIRLMIQARGTRKWRIHLSTGCVSAALNKDSSL